MGDDSETPKVVSVVDSKVTKIIFVLFYVGLFFSVSYIEVPFFNTTLSFSFIYL